MKVSDYTTTVKVSVSRTMTCRACLMDKTWLHAQGSEERACKRQAFPAVLAAGIYRFIC